MKTTFIALAAVAGLSLFAFSGTAEAGGIYTGHRGGSHGHYHGHQRHYSHGGHYGHSHHHNRHHHHYDHYGHGYRGHNHYYNSGWYGGYGYGPGFGIVTPGFGLYIR